MTLNKKTSDTTIRVLETLKFLAKNNASVNDIIKHFEKTDPQNRIYTSEVILKYINTLKVFGYRFAKEKDKYVLLNFPCQIDLNEKDLRTIQLIEQLTKVIPEEKIKADVTVFLQNLEKRFSNNTRILANKIAKPAYIDLNFNYEKYSKQIKEYEKYCIEGQKIKITYKLSNDKEHSIIAEPKEIKYHQDEVYFSIYNALTAHIQDVNFTQITEIKQLPIKSNEANILATTTFRLKGGLAVSYKLHQGEKLLQIESDGSNVILNNREDKKFLLKRLMRYGKNCEVISPKNLRTEMANLIENTIKNYK